MTNYEKELQELKTWDTVESTTILNEGTLKGYGFIYTCGHGYLIVPKTDKDYKLALSICSFGFKGQLACYLEEDCEISEFANRKENIEKCFA